MNDLGDAGRPSLQDRIDIQDVICAMTMHVDHNEYDQALALFTDDGVMKYGDLFGSGFGSQPAADFLNYVQTYMPGFDATQHQITNFDIRVTEDAARVRSHVRASHWIDGRDWLVASVYHHALRRTQAGWRITEMGVRALYDSGHDMVVEAAARVRERRNAPAG